jgi:hypothetical protein
VCGAPVAARLQLAIGFFIEDKLLRLVFDTAALRRCGDEYSNNLAMHPFALRTSGFFRHSSFVIRICTDACFTETLDL